MEFDEEHVCALVLGGDSHLRMGKSVHAKSEPFTIRAGDECLGRMLTALGDPCDGGSVVEAEEAVEIFRSAPSLMDRRPIDTFLATGCKVVDILTPIGCGQRQLVLGDRMTGKTSLALDAILNQSGRDVVCIYCCIGKSVSGLEKTMATLHAGHALEYTVVVTATDNAPVAEQFMAPFTASAIGDVFVRRGRDVLVVFDDMTKHAWAYRQVSLLLDRPPGREAYPGDIFYLHTQLMEQAGCFNEHHGAGSMTFLALAETQQGDLTGYIPSNLISMCDGQVVLSSAVFSEGIHPAVDTSLSLSIVGGRAQPDLLRDLSRGVRADYAMYREVERISRMSSVSESAAHWIRRGIAIRMVLQQGHHERCGFAEMVILLYALREGYLDNMPDDDKSAFCETVGTFAMQSHAGLFALLEEASILDDAEEDALEQIVKDFISQREHDATELGEV